MKRRKFIDALEAGGVVSIAEGGKWLPLSREHPHLTIDAAIQSLDDLNLDTATSNGAWSIARTFDHLRQGIEFSIAGYPEEKSRLFQNTIGRVAFSVFRARGAMSHALDQVIPGEQLAIQTREPETARADLIHALELFRDSNVMLKPHFAFGKLDKADYAIAHALHIDNHMVEFN
ncbi:MAG: DUF1569 domain-containing protein [Pseudomonadota bacterium]